MQIGFYKLTLPVQYLEDSNDDKRKACGQAIIDKFHSMVKSGEGGMVLPALTDQDGNRLFDIEYVGPSSVTINNFTKSE